MRKNNILAYQGSHHAWLINFNTIFFNRLLPLLVTSNMRLARETYMAYVHLIVSLAELGSDEICILRGKELEHKICLWQNECENRLSTQ